MTAELKGVLQLYLDRARDALVWKVSGLGEYDVRRPLTPTGTNLLGLVKHLAGIELEYFGECCGRPSPVRPDWWSDDAPDNADMWARPDESVDSILELYRLARSHADETVAALELDAPALVPWWPEERRNTSLQVLLVHMIAETARHAGHADIVREHVDGAAGMYEQHSNLPGDHDWAAHHAQVERAAREAAS